MDKLSGPDWFAQKYQRPGEKKFNAMTRLSAESGVTVKTLARVLNRQPVAAKTVKALVAIAGEDVLDRDSLIFPTPEQAEPAQNGARAKRRRAS